MAYDACIFFRVTIGFSASGGCLWGVLFAICKGRARFWNGAVGQQIQSCLDGNPDATGLRPGGELYRLFPLR